MLKTFPFVLALLALPWAAAPGGDKTDVDKARQLIIDLTNKHRAADGLAPLKSNATLMAVAQKHAENMARQDKAAHVLDGKGDKDRAREAGYAGVVGENVGRIILRPAASDAAEEAIRGWL